jgi:ankyrin repeat protein
MLSFDRFLLAQLYFGSLTDKTTSKAVRLALEKLPKGSAPDVLDTTYNEVMQRIDDQPTGFRELGRKVLSWITYARRPLTVEELRHAIAVEPDESELDEENFADSVELVSACAGLVTIEEESQIIRLVHYTTQEYFERVRSKLFPQAQNDITRTCLTFLSFEKFKAPYDTDGEMRPEFSKSQGEEGMMMPKSDPLVGPLTYREQIANQNEAFTNYATRNWGYHACECSGEEMHEYLLECLKDSFRLEFAAQTTMVRYFSGKWMKRSLKFTGLHFCAYFGMAKPMKALLDEGSISINTQDLEMRTPLSCAAERGQEGIVRLLLSYLDIHVNLTNNYKESPLAYAVRNGHEAIVQLLLNRPDIDVNSQDVSGISPLMEAAQLGYGGIVQVFLEQDDVLADSKDGKGRTPLVHAASYGHEAIVRVLLERDDVSADSKGIFELTPLSYAAGCGHEAIVRVLLERDDVLADSKDIYGRTALSHAASRGHEAIVRVLLERDDVSADSKDTGGRTLLSYAAGSGDEAVVRLILSWSGPETSVPAKHGGTPLWYAIQRRNEEAIRLLGGSSKPGIIAVKEACGRNFTSIRDLTRTNSLLLLLPATDLLEDGSAELSDRLQPFAVALREHRPNIKQVSYTLADTKSLTNLWRTAGDIIFIVDEDAKEEEIRNQVESMDEYAAYGCVRIGLTTMKISKLENCEKKYRHDVSLIQLRDYSEPVLKRAVDFLVGTF